MPFTPEPQDPATGMTHAEMKAFVRNHFEEFVNRKNLDIADVNFAPEFVDHGADVPPGTPPGPAGAKAYVGGAYVKFPDLHVTIEDLIAEGDKVVVRNTWQGTEAATGNVYQFSGIVIWRIAHGQLVERWAYLQPPHKKITLSQQRIPSVFNTGDSPCTSRFTEAREMPVAASSLRP